MSWRKGAAAAGPNACPSSSDSRRSGTQATTASTHDAALGQLERVAGEVELAEQLKEWSAEDEAEVGGIRGREVSVYWAAHGDHHGCGIDESAGEEAQPCATLGFSP